MENKTYHNYHFLLFLRLSSYLFDRNHHAVLTLHILLDALKQPSELLARPYHHARYVLPTHNDAAVTQRKGTVASPYRGALRQRGHPASQRLVRTQRHGITSGWQIVMGMFHGGAYRAPVDYYHTVHAIRRITITLDFYYHSLFINYELRITSYEFLF